MNTADFMNTANSTNTGHHSADSGDTEILGFEGVPFNPVAIGSLVPAVLTRQPAAVFTQDAPSGPLAEIRAGVVTAHRAALAAQAAVQWQILRRASRGPRHPLADLLPLAPKQAGAAPEGSFKPLARSAVDELDRSALEGLARGEVGAVFGAAYAQPGANPDIRLARVGPLVLDSVTDIGLRSGAVGLGSLRARYSGSAEAAAAQAAEVFALYAGLHLCFADAQLVTDSSTPDRNSDVSGSAELELIVTDIGLVPRPHLRAEVVLGGERSSLEVRSTVTEKPFGVVGPGPAGSLATWTGRIGINGDRALLNEFHMAHLARGDQGIALGPEFAHYTGVRATRLPTGGLLLVDRIMSFDGVRGTLDEQVVYRSEYDSPADSWYYA
ncbi:MAG: beta-ketoacyl synthase, partial [Rhodococcus sp. (in: high G+C Gram-positive bacteria)]